MEILLSYYILSYYQAVLIGHLDQVVLDPQVDQQNQEAQEIQGFLCHLATLENSNLGGHGLLSLHSHQGLLMKRRRQWCDIVKHYRVVLLRTMTEFLTSVFDNAYEIHFIERTFIYTSNKLLASFTCIRFLILKTTFY